MHCEGFTKKNKKCSRTSQSRYCWQHSKSHSRRRSISPVKKRISHPSLQRAQRTYLRSLPLEIEEQLYTDPFLSRGVLEKHPFRDDPLLFPEMEDLIRSFFPHCFFSGFVLDQMDEKTQEQLLEYGKINEETQCFVPNTIRAIKENKDAYGLLLFLQQYFFTRPIPEEKEFIIPLFPWKKRNEILDEYFVFLQGKENYYGVSISTFNDILRENGGNTTFQDILNDKKREINKVIESWERWNEWHDDAGEILIAYEIDTTLHHRRNAYFTRKGKNYQFPSFSKKYTMVPMYFPWDHGAVRHIERRR